MNRVLTMIAICAITTLWVQKLKATTVVWDLQSTYGITQDGIASTITDAREHFLSYPNDTIIVYIGSGSYNIGGNGSHGISFGGGFSPGSQGRLIFQGAGMSQTTLVFTDLEEKMIYGVNAYRLEFRDMHMTRDRYTVSQGTVVSVAPGEVVLDIEPGFPHPTLQDFVQDWGQGRFLRRYTKSKTDPQIIQTNNNQVAWGWRNGALFMPEQISGDRWRFFLNNPNQQLNNYSAGDYVGIKSKKTGEIYWFAGGDDLVFRNIKWTHASRGLVRNGFSNVRLYGCRIERAPAINGQTPCLSTSEGGPQMNQYERTGNSVSTNMVVEDCFIDSPGDDCVAFFNVDGGVVKNSVLRNSFARGILAVEEAEDICIANTDVYNSVISYEGFWTTTHVFGNNVTEAFALSGPFNNSCEDTQTTGSSDVQLFFNTVYIYPNPAKDFLNIDFSNSATQKTVSIVDIQGRVVFKKSSAEAGLFISTSDFPKGVYLVKVNGNETVDIQKVIVE